MACAVQPGRAMSATKLSLTRYSFGSLLTLACCAAVVAAQGSSYSAVASIKTAGGVSSTAPVSVTVDRLATDAQRDELVAAIKKGGTEAAHAWLAKQPDAGSLQVGARKTAIKYAYRRAMGDGGLVTVATANPIAFVGAGVPGAKSTSGFLLGIALLTVPGSGEGSGEMSPAAKVKVDKDGAIVTEDFNPQELVHLSKITKK